MVPEDTTLSGVTITPRSLDGIDITGLVRRKDWDDTTPAYTGRYSDVLIGEYTGEDGQKCRAAITIFRLHHPNPPTLERLRAYLKREAPAWVRLRHRNVVRFLGLDESLGRYGCPALISSWCTNGHVLDFLRGHPGVETKVHMMLGIADGLRYLHENAVIHGDLNPSSILIDDSGQPLLTDWGRASLLTERGFTTAQMGATVRYQAPEVFAEERGLKTKASDIYSLGMLFSEASLQDSQIWTELAPYGTFTKDAVIILRIIMLQERPSRPEDPSEQTTALWELLENCWKAAPQERLGILEVNVRLTDIFSKGPSITASEPLIQYELCCSLLWDLLDQGKSVRNQISCIQRREAQHMADFLAKVLADDNVTRSEKTKRLVAILSTFAKSAQVYPTSYELRGVNCDLSKPESLGGFGDVCQGVYEGSPVCVKVARVYQRQDNTQMLQVHAKEFVLWAYLSHENIVPFYGVYLSQEEAPRICIVSPWMQNGDLKKYLSNNPDAPRLLLLSDVISGLHYLHSSNIIHADLKAVNILVSDFERAMIADFGISQIALSRPTTNIISTGTTYWTAPEVITIEDARPTLESDIWSFGCLCYEVLTGKQPFERFFVKAKLYYALATSGAIPAAPEDISHIDGKIQDLMIHCWDYNPKQRPTSADTLQIFNGLELTDNRPPLPSPNPKGGFRGKARSDVVIDYQCVSATLKRIQAQILEEGETNTNLDDGEV